MYISKKDAFELFSHLDSIEDGSNNSYFENQTMIDHIFVQLECAVEKRLDLLKKEINNLQSVNNRTHFVGNPEKFSKGCYSCLCGSGLSTIRKTNKCNAKCDFCYYYGALDCQPTIPEGMWEIGGTRFYEKDIDMLISICNRPSGVAYAYLEPFLEIDKYYGIIEKFHKAGIYQHLYTNGIAATEESIKKLGDAGLNELRFNLGATNCSKKVIENIRTAKKYISAVGIETPMTPKFFESFMNNKNEILNTGLDFINCAELHLTTTNIDNFKNESLYMCRFGYISPIWSHELTYKFMSIAEKEGWDIAVHDCCNLTKFARDLNYSNKLNMWYGACSYSNEFDTIPYRYFLPALADPTITF